MKPRVKIEKSNTHVFNIDLIDGQFKTYLSSSISSGVSSITVDDISGISAGTGKYLLIGRFGDPDAEIVTVHTSTAPSGSTVTLNAATTKAHTESDPVVVLDFNQIEYSRATTSGGAKSTLATQVINPTSEYSLYNDTSNTTGFGYARFYNSASTTYSEYSVEVPYTGYSKDTVGQVITEVCDELGITPDYDLGMIFINEGLEDINNRKNKWSPKRELGYVLGQTSSWENKFTIPTTVRNPYDSTSFIEIRLGDSDNKLTFVDYQELKRQMSGVCHSTISTEASASDTTLVLESSYDFKESGTVYAEGHGTSGITYTGNTQSSGTLTGVPASGDGAVTTTLPVGSSVWQDADVGEPVYWSINEDGKIEIYPLPSSDYVDKNVYCDFYKRVTTVDDLADSVNTGWLNPIKKWLRWKFRAKKQNRSVASIQDSDYQLYEAEINRVSRLDKGDKFFAFRNVRDTYNPNYATRDNDILD